MKVIKTGQWEPTAECPPNVRSYHFDTFTSPVALWDDIAAKFIAAKDAPSKLKTFYNLTLGLPYDVTGDAPDHERLMERAAPDLKRGTIPPRGVVLVGGADVQGNGIYYIVRAFAPDGQNWPVDSDFIAGDTTDPRAGAFADLREAVILRDWPDAYGGKRRLDMLAIDSGFRTHVVYTFCRDLAGQHVLPVKGDEGWSKVALGLGKKVDITFANQTVRGGTMRYPVGTWPLKSDFYADLRLKGMASGAPADPRRYVHFAKWQDAEYYKQITGEYLKAESFRGRTRQIWAPVPGKENHLLDCEIYLRAVFWWLTERLSAADWEKLSADRGVAGVQLEPDMFAPAPARVMTDKPKERTSDAARRSGGRGWFKKG
jgi:phage terminase large subunit GpA-like protein